jgi:hypothetical protein
MAMDVCREVVPPEVRFPDGVRVACHLYAAGRDGAIEVDTAAVAAYRAPLTTALPSSTAPAAELAS